MSGGAIRRIQLRSSLSGERVRHLCPEFDVRYRTACLAIVTLATIEGCSSSTGISDCGPNTTATFHSEIEVVTMITSIMAVGQSKLIETGMEGTPPGKATWIVADTTAVFERFGEGAPHASNACRLAVGQVVEIPLSDGFGDFVGDVPPPTLHQLVIKH